MRKPIATRRTSRLLAGALLFAFAGVLGGCSSFAVPSWDPTDLLDFLDTKKRAPGERKPVFPDGVPGISQGVPKEMVRGSAESRAAAESQAAASAPPPEAQPGPPPGKRTKTAAKRPPARAPADAQVEIAPDDVNVEDEPPPPPPRRQSQRSQRTTQPQAEQQANPFPAPLPR
jgi:hypothetical protein